MSRIWTSYVWHIPRCATCWRYLCSRTSTKFWPPFWHDIYQIYLVYILVYIWYMSVIKGGQNFVEVLEQRYLQHVGDQTLFPLLFPTFSRLFPTFFESHVGKSFWDYFAPKTTVTELWWPQPCSRRSFWKDSTGGRSLTRFYNWVSRGHCAITVVFRIQMLCFVYNPNSSSLDSRTARQDAGRTSPILNLKLLE